MTGEADGYERLLKPSMEALRAKTAAHQGAWHFGEADSWNLDQDEGNLVFTFPTMTATAPAQIIGTFTSEDGTWLWGWDHPSVAEALQKNARKVKAYGQEHAISQLTTCKISCTEADAWELTALACDICGEQGAYRGPAGGDVYVFMTLD